MPRMSAAVYAAHIDNLLKFARSQEGGVSRADVASELNVSLAVASTVIEKAGLVEAGKKGKAVLYSIGDGAEAPAPKKQEAKQSKPELAPEVEAVATPESSDTGDFDQEEVASIDAQIIDTRNALRAAGEKAGKALQEWATHQALFDAMQKRLTELAVEKMRLST